MNPFITDPSFLGNTGPDASLPRWACAVGVLQAVAIAVCLTLVLV